MGISALDELLTEQDTKIRYITSFAYTNSHFYRTLFDSAGLDPRQVQPGSGEEFLRESLRAGVKTTPENLASGDLYPEYITRIYATQVLTSGSTGDANTVYYSMSDLDRSNYQSKRLFQVVPVQEADVLVAFPAPFPAATSVLYPESFKASNNRSIAILPPDIRSEFSRNHNIALLSSVYHMLQSLDSPLVMMGRTHSMEILGHHLTEFGFDLSKIEIKAMQLGGESSTLQRRNSITHLWQPHSPKNVCYDVYGSTEASVIGFSCVDHEDYHICPEVLVFAEKDGEPLPTGEEGNDCVSILPQQGSWPGTIFINYSHGDLIRCQPHQTCDLPYMMIERPSRKQGQMKIQGVDIDIKNLERLFKDFVVFWQKPKHLGEPHKLVIRVTDDVTPSDKLESQVLDCLCDSEPYYAHLVLSNPDNLSLTLETYPVNRLYVGYENYLRSPGDPKLITLPD